jgi:hypothetical protein
MNEIKRLEHFTEALAAHFKLPNGWIIVALVLAAWLVVIGIVGAIWMLLL